MRYMLGLALLLLPATAFAQMFEGPSGSIPVIKCERPASGAVCGPVVEGLSLTSSRGYSRVDPADVVAPSRVVNVEARVRTLAR